MSGDSDPRIRSKIIAAFATIYLVWGSTFLAIRVGVTELPPMLFAGGRFLLAGALLAVLGRAFNERFPATTREWRYVALFSVLMITLSNGVSVVALQYIPSNEGALLAAGSALWIAWFGTFGPRGHRLTRSSIAGLALGFCGVVLLVWPQEARPTGHLGWQALMLSGSVFWALGTVLYRNAQLPIGPMAFNAGVMALGGTWLMIAGLTTGELSRWRWNVAGVAALVYLAVFGSALAYTAYAWLLKHAPTDRVGTFAYVNPAIATVLGWAVLDERLSGAQIAGMLVVLVSVALVTMPSLVRPTDPA